MYAVKENEVIKSMHKWSCLFLVFLISGCFFNDSYHLEKIFPVTLYIVNSTKDKIVIDEFYTKEGQKGVFFYDKKIKIKPVSTVQEKIRFSELDTIKERRFFMGGRCKDGRKWISNEKNTKVEVLGNNDVNLILDVCAK